MDIALVSIVIRVCVCFLFVRAQHPFRTLFQHIRVVVFGSVVAFACHRMKAEDLALAQAMVAAAKGGGADADTADDRAIATSTIPGDGCISATPKKTLVSNLLGKTKTFR